MTGIASAVRTRVERLGFRALYRLADLTYALGVATPKRTVAGTYWSYEPTNPHGDDPGLAALAALPEDAVVLDVGAHVGEHAIPLARGTDREVVALEPHGGSADRLVRNARRNDLGDGDGLAERVDLRRAGAGDARATLTFYRSTFSKCSAFDRGSATRWGARVADTEAVPVRRIDDLVAGVDGSAEDDASGGGTTAEGNDASPVPPPDAIKVDVEGHEAAVLRGAAVTLTAHRPLLVVEVHDADGGTAATDGTDDDAALRAWLAERGYAVTEAGDLWICRPEDD